MTDNQEENIKKIVYLFSESANLVNEVEIDKNLKELTKMNINDAIDKLLVGLSNLVDRKVLKKEDILDNVDLLIALNPEKYKKAEDVIKRLNWLKEMNMTHPQMALNENHQLVMETFDKFNELIQNRFDCYYTGGLMGYLATRHKLERYHGDLDLFINEEQLMDLKELVDSSENFHFISNMNNKEEIGHEYIITYRNTPMSIGLFLFARKMDGSIITKEYYYEGAKKKELMVNEHHFSKEYTELFFSEQKREHNGLTYKMMSLESIYNAKKNSRPKDRHDANIIKDKVDLTIDNKIDICKKKNFDILHKKVDNTIIQDIENLIQ